SRIDGADAEAEERDVHFFSGVSAAATDSDLYHIDRTPLRQRLQRHKDTGKQIKRTQNVKQTGPLTSTGVPSPPPSYGVSSPCKLYYRLWSLLEDTELELFVVAPLGGPPPTLSSAHTLGLTVFPEVPCCQVTLCPSTTTDRAFPCTNPQRAHNTGPFCYRTCARKRGPWGASKWSNAWSREQRDPELVQQLCERIQSRPSVPLCH
ncbi:Calpain-11, partial [Dissostichus eleginoides]